MVLFLPCSSPIKTGVHILLRLGFAHFLRMNTLRNVKACADSHLETISQTVVVIMFDCYLYLYDAVKYIYNLTSIPPFAF